MFEELIAKYTDEECRMFTELVMEMGEEWYRYMHGERTEPDAPETLMKRHLKFFDGDWMGLIDFDLSMGAWSTKYFYNKETDSSSETLIQDAECAEQAIGWMVAIRNNAPIIIEDIESIKETAPKEYAMYKRLKVESVLAVPYRNNGSGLLVVRNPKRFKTNYVALNIMSYIITSELNAIRRRRNISRKTVDYEPKNYNEVQIRLFGEMKIIGKDLMLQKNEIPEPIRFLIAYLALNPGKAICAEKLNELYGEKISSWKNLIYKFRTKWKTVRFMDGDENQLIITIDRGYMLNPDMNIFVDAIHVSEMMKAIEDSGDIKAQIEMLRKFMAMYYGEFMENENMDNQFIQEYKSLYNTTFVAKMDKLLELLYSQRQFSALIGYSMDILKIYPGSVNAYAWRIAAFRQQGQMDLVKTTQETAASMFDEEEIRMLDDKVNRILTAGFSKKALFFKEEKPTTSRKTLWA